MNIGGDNRRFPVHPTLSIVHLRNRGPDCGPVGVCYTASMIRSVSARSLHTRANTANRVFPPSGKQFLSRSSRRYRVPRRPAQAGTATKRCSAPRRA